MALRDNLTIDNADGPIRCGCGYTGDEGWIVRDIYETVNGDRVTGRFCPDCGGMECEEGFDCGPDEFGQT